MTIEVSGLTPLSDEPETVYVLEVDDDYNVKPVENLID